MDTVLDSVRQVKPPSLHPTPAQHARQRQALLEHINGQSGEEAAGRAISAPSPRPVDHSKSLRRRARLLVLSVALGLLVIALIALFVIPQSRSPQAAAAELRHLADTALDQTNPTPTPTATQSLYSKRTGEVTESFSQVNGVSSPGAEATFPVTLETWARNDGSVAFRVQFGDPRFASSAAESAWSEAGLPMQISSSPQVGMASSPQLGATRAATPPLVMDVSDLPTDPSKLAALLEDGQTGIPQIDQVPAGSDAAVQRVALLLMGPLSGSTPQFDAALYRVLSSLPGVQLLGPTTTHSGRSGIGFSLSSSSSSTDQERLIVDSSTGTLLEVQNVPIGFGAPFDQLFLPTNELIGRLPEPRTAGGFGLPGHALWFDTVAGNRVVQDGALPPDIAQVFSLSKGVGS